MLYIWKSGPCPDGKINMDGMCNDWSPPIIMIVLIAGGVTILVGVGVVFAIKKFKKRSQMSESLLGKPDQ